ncbi:hypothetical protein BVC80_209g66 [Macleaya cordata]|uniref:Uncharacterized protein n=1 Tax=Macleaya cordata TaxID=56857 RepID=A0A200QD63_MACCD|nr:hypothetical protein BVC80_209g66 [Macleaya cordata]
MAYDEATPNQTSTHHLTHSHHHHHHQHHKSSNFRWSTRRRLLGGRRRKVPSVRLGGEKKPRRGLLIASLFRRIRLKWLKLQYSCMLKKLKDVYYSMVKDLIEAGTTLESIQQRIMTETYFSVPVMGAPSAGIASYVGPRYSNRVRSQN